MKAAQRNQISGTKKVIISFEKTSNNMASRHSLDMHWEKSPTYVDEKYTYKTQFRNTKQMLMQKYASVDLR